MSNLTIKSSELSVKNTDDNTREFSGYASTFNGVDSYGDTIAPGAFAETIQNHRSSDTVVPILFEHGRDLDSHVGEVLDMEEDENGLFIRGRLDNTEAGLRAYNLVKGRRIKGLSIGFYPLEVTPDESDGTPVTSISQIDLREISLVMFPADPRAEITSVKSAMSSGRPPASSVVSARELSALTKGLDVGGDMSAFTDSLDRQLELLESRAAADHYLETLLKRGPLGGRSRGNELGADGRARVELRAVEHILRTAEKRGTGLTKDEAEHIHWIRHRVPAEWQSMLDSAYVVESLKAAMSEHGDKSILVNNPHVESANERTNMLPLTKSTAPRVAERAVTQVREKSLAGLPSARLSVSYDTGAIIDQPRPAVNLLELMPSVRVDNNPVVSYLQQTDRELRAGIVPVGEAKPISKLDVKRVDVPLQVVAHIVRGLDEYLLRDVSALQSFIEKEMIAGVIERVENWIVQELYRADGHQLQTFDSDPFTTVRMGLSGLQAMGLAPGAVVLNPDTWARMETTKATGDGQFVFNGAPVNQEQRLLWGVPVVTSINVPENSGVAVDLNSVQIFHDGVIDLAWHTSGEEFERNQLALRAEGRFRPVVTRSPGMVEMLLSADAEPQDFPDPIPGGAETAEGTEDK